MRILTLILGALIVTLMATRVSAAEKTRSSGQETCKIVTGYVTAIGRGATKNDARDDARFVCGSAMIEQYLATRSHIPEDVKDELATACVNLDCQ